MGFSFHVPLPGPFSYSARIGGKKRRHSAQDLARDAERRAAERAEQVRRAGVEQDELLGRIEQARPLLAAETVASLDAEAARMVELEPASVRWSYRAGKVRALLGDVDGQGGALERTTARLDDHAERTRARTAERSAEARARRAEVRANGQAQVERLREQGAQRREQIRVEGEQRRAAIAAEGEARRVAAQVRHDERVAGFRDRRAAAGAELREARESLSAVPSLRESMSAQDTARRDGYAERIEALRAGGADVAALDAGLAAMDAETGGSWTWNRRAEELRRALKRAER